MAAPVSPLPPLAPSAGSTRAGMPSMAANTTGIEWTAGNDRVTWCEGGKPRDSFSSDESSVHEFSDCDLRRSESNSRRNSGVGGQISEVHPPVGLMPPATAVRLTNVQARLSASLRIEVDQNFHLSTGSLAGAEGAGAWTSGGAGTNYSCGTPTTPTTPGMLVFCVHTEKKTKKSRR